MLEPVFFFLSQPWYRSTVRATLVACVSRVCVNESDHEIGDGQIISAIFEHLDIFSFQGEPDAGRQILVRATELIPLWSFPCFLIAQGFLPWGRRSVDPAGPGSRLLVLGGAWRPLHTEPRPRNRHSGLACPAQTRPGLPSLPSLLQLMQLLQFSFYVCTMYTSYSYTVYILLR